MAEDNGSDRNLPASQRKLQKAREEGQRVGRLVFVGTDGMSIGDNVTAESLCDAATIASERQPLQEWSVTSSSEAADASVC